MRAAAVAMAMGDTDLLHEGSKVIPEEPPDAGPSQALQWGEGDGEGRKGLTGAFQLPCASASAGLSAAVQPPSFEAWCPSE